MTLKLPITESGSATSDEESQRLRVGDLAQRTNKTVRALHLYEELGLLHPSERSKGGFRIYGPDATVRVRWISKLQEMGFSLPEIQEILRDWEQSESAPGAMFRVRELYTQKLKETETQLERLAELKSDLGRSLEYLATCSTCDPERLITACCNCDLHGCDAPELVAGLHSQKH